MQGRTVLITGRAQGIGAETARQLVALPILLPELGQWLSERLLTR